MKKINSMFEKVGLDVNKKLPVAQCLRGHFLNELQKDIKWHWHPSAVITDSIKILKIASVHEELNQINSLFKNVGLDVKKKMLVIQYFKNHFMNELKKDLK